MPTLLGPGKLIERVVIGVFANAQHGKSTVATLICEEMTRLERKAKQFALADPLKEVAVHLLGMPPEVAWGHGVTTSEREHLRRSWRKYDKNGREWLQWIGTELARDQIDEDLWLDRAVDTVVMDSDGVEVFVISDCRFHNEREKLKIKLAKRFIRFHRLKVYRPGIAVDMSHPSESEVATMSSSMFDSLIDNDAGLDELRVKVAALCLSISRSLGTGVGG